MRIRELNYVPRSGFGVGGATELQLIMTWCLMWRMTLFMMLFMMLFMTFKVTLWRGNMRSLNLKFEFGHFSGVPSCLVHSLSIGNLQPTKHKERSPIWEYGKQVIYADRE